MAPTSNAGRIARINALASGFIYYVSLKGVTGAANLDIDSVKAKLAEIRGISQLPLGVGFGVREPADAANLAAIADGVIVGSTLVKIVEENADQPDKIPGIIGETLSKFRHAMDNAA